MKEAISLLLALVMCLSLCACGGGETAESPYEKYAKYEELFMYLESNDYDNANAYIQNFFGMTGEANKPEQTEPENKETEPVETEPTFTTVEISLKNWTNYFELKMDVVEKKNDFNELVCIYPQMNLCLKEEWKSVATDMEIAVEYSCTNGYACWFTYNVETGELIEGETDDSVYASSEKTETFTLKKNNIEKGIVLFGGVHSDTFTLEENIVTIRGTMFADVEIIRIQGTLTVAE